MITFLAFGFSVGVTVCFPVLSEEVVLDFTSAALDVPTDFAVEVPEGFGVSVFGTSLLGVTGGGGVSFTGAS